MMISKCLGYAIILGSLIGKIKKVPLSSLYSSNTVEPLANKGPPYFQTTYLYLKSWFVSQIHHSVQIQQKSFWWDYKLQNTVQTHLWAGFA